jgi:hypothetical protein
MADGISVNKEKEKGLSLFKNRFIIPNHVINPSELVESLLMIDNFGTSSAESSWTKVKADGKDPEPEFQNQILYQSIVDKKFVNDSTYLSFTSSLENDDKAELIVQDIFRFRGKQFSSEDIREAATRLVTAFNKPGRRFFYVQSVQYSTVEYRVFKKITGKAQFAGVGFGAGGQYFSSTSNYAFDPIVSINYIPLEVTTPTPVVNSGPQGPTSNTQTPMSIPGSQTWVDLKEKEPNSPLGIKLNSLKPLE